MFVNARAVVGVFALLTVLVAAVPAVAQGTREEALAAERAAKATELRPYEPTALERKIHAIDGMLVGQRPIYPFIGSTYEGGGLAIGPGFRSRLGDAGMFNAHAAISIRNYRAAHADVKLPDLAGGRVDVDVTTDWLDAPAVAFYGVGNDSTPEEKTSIALRSTAVGITARIRPVKYVALGGGVDALTIDTLAAAPGYRRSRVFAEIDWRTSPGYTRRGGLYRFDWSEYQGGGQHNFRRVDAEVNQFVPLLRENWVIAMRALVSSTDTRDGHTVPVVLLPALGGGNSLRGYPSWRFRDRHRLLLTGEYRWTAGPFVDMALFMDAGKVAPRFADLDLDDLKTSYGIGATLHTFRTTLTRVELARTREGMGLSFSFGANF